MTQVATFNNPILNRITLEGDPNEMLQTGYGTITYRRWLEIEHGRWARAGKKSEIKEENGLISLWAYTNSMIEDVEE